ncbi:hypothetical protein EJK15_40070 [Nonomuraea basaltis]|nr:hypothetical protein EJK15_40070 [Nonomuraea basaltis]
MSAEQLVEWALEGQEGDACWFWPHLARSREGYTKVRVNRRTLLAHRLVYEVRVGSVPPGAVVDHACHDPRTCRGGPSCRHRACINPSHLIATSREVNTSRGRASHRKPDECKWGHPFTPENTYMTPKGARTCRTCRAARLRESRERHKVRSGWADGRHRAGGQCRNGHDVADVGVDEHGDCRGCLADRQARSNETRRERRAQTRPRPGWVDGRRRADGRCRNGHDLAEAGVGSTGRCRACRRAEYEKRKAKDTTAFASFTPTATAPKPMGPASPGTRAALPPGREPLGRPCGCLRLWSSMAHSRYSGSNIT